MNPSEQYQQDQYKLQQQGWWFDGKLNKEDEVYL
jgi:hypothetical protein